MISWLPYFQFLTIQFETFRFVGYTLTNHIITSKKKLLYKKLLSIQVTLNKDNQSPGLHKLTTQLNASINTSSLINEFLTNYLKWDCVPTYVY